MIRAVALLFVFVCTTAFAADSFHVGWTNRFIDGNLNFHGWTCPAGLICPANVQPINDGQGFQSLQAATINQHVHVFREVVNFAAVAPACPNGQPPACGGDYGASVVISGDALCDCYSFIDQMLSHYTTPDFNAVLILGFGETMPPWAAPYATQQNGVCWMPQAADQAGWDTVKMNIAYAIGTYLQHFIKIGLENPNGWNVTSLIIEPWANFDAPQSNTTGCADTTLATPARMVDLLQTVSNVLRTVFSVKVNAVSSPSFTGAYTGPLSSSYTSVAQLYQNYAADFATLGQGVGNFQAHYFTAGDGTVPGIVMQTGQIINAICAGLGPLCGSLIFGESGWQQVVPGLCPAGGLAIPDPVRDQLYAGFAADPTINRAQIITFTESVQYQPPAGPGGCADTWGVLGPPPNMLVSPAVQNLTNYLQAH